MHLIAAVLYKNMLTFQKYAIYKIDSTCLSKSEPCERKPMFNKQTLQNLFEYKLVKTVSFHFAFSGIPFVEDQLFDHNRKIHYQNLKFSRTADSMIIG